MTTPVLTISALALAACLFGSHVYAADDMHDKMMKDKECMTVVKTGNADVDFIGNMIPRHNMALEMAKKELKGGKATEARAMAEKILDDQQKEIAEMESWLKAHE